jgi:putative transposase
VGQVDRQRRLATVARLAELRAAGSLTTEHVRLAAVGHGVDERTVWRWLDRSEQSRPPRPERYQLTQADREAYAHFRGNVTGGPRHRSDPGDR